jgi:hypothetical protein
MSTVLPPGSGVTDENIGEYGLTAVTDTTARPPVVFAETAEQITPGTAHTAMHTVRANRILIP